MIGLLAAAIVGAMAGFALGAAIVVFILKLPDIIKYFRSKQQLTESDKANIRFTLMEHIENEDYEVIRGIFNKRTNEIVDAEKVQAKTIDEELAKAHQNHELVVYEA
jgi:DNA repair protein RadC